MLAFSFKYALHSSWKKPFRKFQFPWHVISQSELSFETIFFFSLQKILNFARPDAKKAVFLITDGYSNGGDPRFAARRLREEAVEMFTFGIRNGNVRELFDMASEPQHEHSYIVDSFEEFEALARRALHEGIFFSFILYKFVYFIIIYFFPSK